MIAGADLGPSSRPLRALALALLFYGAGRAGIVWLTAPQHAPAGRQFAGGSLAGTVRSVVPPAIDAPAAEPRSPTLRFVVSPQQVYRVSTSDASAPRGSGTVLTLTRRPVEEEGLTVEPVPPAPRAVPVNTVRVPQLATSPNRWSGSFYAVTRGSSAIGAAPMLGGTQAGVRGYRALLGKVSATASLAASPGRNGTREATVGVALRTGAVGVIAERSFGLDGGTSGLRLLGFAGIARALPARFELNGYGQAGVTPIGMFADGSQSIERPVLKQGKTALSVGFGTWGSTQRGAHRIDIGPQLVARLPLAKQHMRVSAEWRVRIAGNASPGSGPAITLGADF